MARITSYAFDADTVENFLSNIGQIHLVAIHRSGNLMLQQSRFFGDDVAKASAWAMAQNQEHKGVYFTLNLVPDGFSKKPKKENITGARFVHCDLDPPMSGAVFDKIAAIETLEGITYPPTAIIDSGNGLQPIWLLDGIAQNKEAIERINKQIIAMFGADRSCFNIDRLLRLPGCINWPNAAKEKRGRKPVMSSMATDFSGECYDPADLAAFFPEPEEPSEHLQRVAATIGNVELLTPDDMAMTAFNPVRLAIEKPKGTDRSVATLHAACEMVREGMNDAQIAGMLLNPANEISGHILDQGDPKRAVERVIGRARGEEPDMTEVAPETRAAVAAIGAKHVPSIYTAEPEKPAKAELPAWHGGLTGGLRLMVETIMEYAPAPRLELALGAAIACFATAMGRRYQTPSGLMSNLYIVGLSPSGSGKDLPVNAPGHVLMMCGDDGVRMVGGSEVVSARGIMTAVEASPTLYIPLDEMGKLLQAMQDPRGHLKEAVAVLLKLYSQAQSVFKGAMYANSKERPTTLIHRPCLSFFGVSNPSAFWEKLTRTSISDGLLPRFILLPDRTAKAPPPRRLRRAVYPDALVDAVKRCMMGAQVEGHKPFPLGDGSSMAPKPYVVEYENQAADDMEYELRLRQDRMSDEVDLDMLPFVNRLAENAMKLALVRAVSDNPASPVMRVADMEWGWGISERSVREFMTECEGNISENDHEATAKKVRAFIESTGKAGALASEIGRKFQHVPKRAREEIMDDLETNGFIRHEKTDNPSGKGRPGMRFFGVDAK